MTVAMLRETLADFWTYLGTPRLVAAQPLRDGWGRWAVMLGVYLAGLAVIAPVLVWWGSHHHLSAVGAFSGFSPVVLALAVVLVFPALEESAFRGWLTGRPRGLWLLAMGLVMLALLIAVTLQWHDQVAGVAFVATAIATIAGWFGLRKYTAPPRWFAGWFGVWFYLSVVVFSLSHVSNYPHPSWAVVPMVAPQAWAGLVFGYVRMRRGLIAAILAHGAGNAAALAAAWLFR